ncbi:MAG: internal scaffolding protein [Microvirus sp.]|nr:MAG: internal scaffolding protein [Microvirus sp.]
MSAPFVRSPYNYDLKEASDESGTHCTDPSLTVQDAADDADINVIVARFGLGMTMPENPRTPQYGDFTGITDYRTAIEAVKGAEEQFMTLPPQLREYFQNSPQQLMEYTETQGQEALVALGLDLTVPQNQRVHPSTKVDPATPQ